MRNIGLDAGMGKYVLCEARDGQIVLRITARSHGELKLALGPHTAPARVAFEACREGWWLHDQLEKWGHVPVMLDSTRIRQLGVGHHRRKNDPIDSEVIVFALERGYVHAAHVLSKDRREIRNQLALRSTLIETRTRYVNVARGLAVSEGLQLPSCSAENFARHARSAAWSATMGPQIEPLLSSLEHGETAIEQATERLHSLCETEPTISRLATVPYVGLITAATFVSVLDDAGRFHDGHQVASYLGLVPSENTSNSAPRLGSITKAGNRWARTMLVQCAWLMLTKGDPEDPLVVWARAIWERRNKFIAAVALARKLAGILWSLWKNETVYIAKRPSPTATAPADSDAEKRVAGMVAAARSKLRPKRRKAATRTPPANAAAPAGVPSTKTPTRAARPRASSSSRGGERADNT